MRFLAVFLGGALGCRTAAEPPRPETKAPRSSSPSISPDAAAHLRSTGIVKGTAYSVDLPPGATKTSAQVNDHWRVKTEDFTFDLLISRNESVLTLEQAVANRGRKVLRSSREGDDRWLFSYEHAPTYDGAMREAAVIASMGALSCEGHLRQRRSDASLDTGLMQLESMCRSLSAP